MKHDKTAKTLITVIGLALLLTPVTAQNSGNFLEGGGEDQAKQLLRQKADKALNIIQLLGFLLAAPFGSYQGYKYITSEHDPSKRKEAKTRIGQIVVGLAIIQVFPFIIQWLF